VRTRAAAAAADEIGHVSATERKKQRRDFVVVRFLCAAADNSFSEQKL